MGVFRLELLRTRVARRIFLLFVLSALVPVALLGTYGFLAIARQLRDQSRERLQQLSKNAGMSVLERLQFAEADVRLVASDQAASAGMAALSAGGPATGVRVEPRRFLSTLRDVVLTAPGGRPDTLSAAPVLTAADQEHLAAEGTLLRVRAGPGGTPWIWLIRRLDPADAASPLLWGHIDDSYLWSSAETYVDLPSVSGFCVLLDVARPLHCAERVSAGFQRSLVDAFRLSPATEGRGVFRWSANGDRHMGSSWEVFLRSRFQAEPWTVVVSEAESAVYARLRDFALAFPPVLLLGMIVVTLLATSLVRRTMEPLEALTEGTRRIAAQEWSTRVDVQRSDEFGELAGSFNTMAERLGVQFRHLEASRAIDQAALVAADREDVARALLDGFGGIVAYDRLAIVILERDPVTGDLLWVEDGRSETCEVQVHPSARDLEQLRSVRPYAEVSDPDEMASLLEGFPTDLRPLVVFPLRVKDELRGALMVARERAFTPDEIVRIRQIVDQGAVALDEVQLVKELEAMNWGTLRALARAIDAKSKWTAGHSERVVRLAVALGEEIGLSARELDTLERGGLLHDVGKIGIPANVLDSDAPLSDEERRLMNHHVLIGARILEPVAAYADAIPIVLYHHERWDGKGYPAGLAGEGIPLLARVLSVADAYDAMASTRPYRGSLTPASAIKVIRGLAGTQFDPRVVEAFERVMARDVHLWRDFTAMTDEVAVPGGRGPSA